MDMFMPMHHDNGALAWCGRAAYHPNGKIAWQAGRAYYADGTVAWAGLSAFLPTGKLAWQACPQTLTKRPFARREPSGIEICLAEGIKITANHWAFWLEVHGQCVHHLRFG